MIQSNSFKVEFGRKLKNLTFKTGVKNENHNLSTILISMTIIIQTKMKSKHVSQKRWIFLTQRLQEWRMRIITFQHKLRISISAIFSSFLHCTMEPKGCKLPS
jgi:hypothetical protein